MGISVETRGQEQCTLSSLTLLSSLPLFLSLSLISDIRSVPGTQGSRISQRQLASKVLRNYVHFCHLSSAGITSTHYHIWLFTWMLGIELRSNKLVSWMYSLGKCIQIHCPHFYWAICLTALYRLCLLLNLHIPLKYMFCILIGSSLFLSHAAYIFGFMVKIPLPNPR